MTYCGDLCSNRECERHIMNAPKDEEISWGYFNQELQCNQYIQPSTINETIDLLKKI